MTILPTMALDSHVLPSKLNIKLKTHSLTSLNIPLETFTSFNRTSAVRRNLLAGSVDLISEISQQSHDEMLNCFALSKPLINIVSSNKQLPPVQQVFKERFHISNSFLSSTSLHDSVARFRRNRQRKNLHQTSLQTIDKISERKNRFSFNYNESIPKFTFRDLPSTSSIHQFEHSSNSRLSPFISLPEIRSFSEQNSLDNPNKTHDKVPLPQLSASSWEKSSSWSWKCNVKKKEIQRQMDDHIRSNLPVIIESPLQQRSTLQTNNQHDYKPLTKLTHIYRSNLSFTHDKIPSHRFYQKKTPLPHSLSNYDVSPNLFPTQSKIRYPSTPILAHTRQNNFDYHSFQFDISPKATFDDESDSDSISSTSSFRSCIDSIDEFSEDSNTESSSSSSSSVSDSSFQELSSTYDLPKELFSETKKYSRLSFRNFCILQ